jgi:RimJ/RimL family protein N-acetyltransferase
MNNNSALITPKFLASLRFIRQKALANPLWQYRTSIGLKRTLATLHSAPPAAIDFTVREMRGSDIPLLFSATDTPCSRQESRDIKTRLSLAQQHIPRCFVAIDASNGAPCFIQWLFGASHNDFIASFFNGRFPRLRSEQGLLECAYTPPQYRGKGLMPAAMSRIAERAPSLGLTELITFVDHNNIPSLKGCAKAGFRPFLTRKDMSVFSTFKSRRFIPIPASPSSTLPLATATTIKENMS